MNIPDEVRVAIIRCSDQAKRERDDGFAQYDLSPEWILLRNWLDNLPKAPEPDWSQAPGVMTHHYFDPYGDGHWVCGESFEVEPRFRLGWRNNSGWGLHLNTASGYQLPVGVDWRTTLRKRPEVE